MAKRTLGRAPASTPAKPAARAAKPAPKPATNRTHFPARPRTTAPAPAPARAARRADTAPAAPPARRPAAPVARAAKPVPATRVRVRALKMGFINNERRRVGEVFSVDRRHFNPSWMLEVGANTPGRRITAKEELKQKHDELLAKKVAGEAIDTDEHDLPTGLDNPLGAD